MTDESWINRLSRAIGAAVERNQPDRGEPSAEETVQVHFTEPDPEGIEGIRLRQERRNAFASLAESMRPVEAAHRRLGEAYRRIHVDMAEELDWTEATGTRRASSNLSGHRHTRVFNLPVERYGSQEELFQALRGRHPLLWRDVEDRLSHFVALPIGDMWALAASVSFTEDDGVDLRELSTNVLRERTMHGYELEVPFEYTSGLDVNHPQFLSLLSQRMPHRWLAAAAEYPRAFNVAVDRDIRSMAWRVSIRTQVPEEAFRSPARMAIEQEAAVQVGMVTGPRVMPPTRDQVLDAFRRREVGLGMPRREYQRYVGPEEPSTVSSQEEPFVPQSGPRKLKLRNPRGKQDVPHSEYQSNQNPVHRRIARRRARDEPKRD